MYYCYEQIAETQFRGRGDKHMTLDLKIRSGYIFYIQIFIFEEIIVIQ